MSDSGTVGSSSNPEPPPPPSTPPNITNTCINREAYGGGADERTPLIDQQPKPINNFGVGQNEVVPISRNKLSDIPNRVTCPRCSKTVTTKLDHNPPGWSSCCKSNYSWRCCWCYSFCCFIPIYIGKSKDVIHHCPDCGCEIARYTKFDSCC